MASFGSRYVAAGNNFYAFGVDGSLLVGLTDADLQHDIGIQLVVSFRVGVVLLLIARVVAGIASALARKKLLQAISKLSPDSAAAAAERKRD